MDLNRTDGFIDILDVILMVNAIEVGVYNATFDLNRDGASVDFLDLVVLLGSFRTFCNPALNV